MEWYYAEKGARVGPIDEAAFQSRVSSGQIKPDTLVWRIGMAEWLPYRSVAAMDGEGSGPISSSEDTRGQCAECGRFFSREELVALGDDMVCAACEPIAARKLTANEPAEERRYAGFWIRVAATLVDGLILVFLQLEAGNLIAMFFPHHGNPADFDQADFNLLAALVCMDICIRIAYETWFVGKYGATPGKMACGLRVIRPDGEQVTYARAAGRAFGQLLSGLLLGVGYLIVAFDDQKRALHDQICDTRVIYKQPGTPH